jgi:uncharacterized protein
MPRLLGYVFNPISTFFCYDRADALCAIVHEVNNTFGERHFYALPVTNADRLPIIQECAKAFRVSPFLPLNLDYLFKVSPPGQSVGLFIAASAAQETVLTASFHGVRKPFTPASIVRRYLTNPALTVKVIAAIHWEALLIWLRLRRARNTPKQSL